MKFKTYILVILLIFYSASGVCLASEGSHAQLFTAFYLDSALGTRTLANQSPVTMEATQGLQPRKSPNEAFLYSLVVPGMGQLYTGAKRGYVYLAAEVGLLTTYFMLRNSASNTREDYRDVVRQHVIFDGPGSFEDWDPIEDFEHATQYENWDHVYDSEETRKRTGKWYWDDAKSFKDEADVDIEFDSPHRLAAFDLRQQANDTFQLARTVLGMAILNHVVSAVEARITTKRINTRLQNTPTQTKAGAFEIDVQTDISARTLAGVLVLRKRF
ncbi:hypothetical protein F4Y59_10515 [Candidatus Poribacteria bacterium]|nr:hypothetical protein [Candidatus Poribacteria bacterium]MYK18075.1 hypothetical protein [Candidatus Poribacteria bacterium]